MEGMKMPEKQFITAWTRQNRLILKDLEEKGRYIARKNFIKADMEDTAPVVLMAYDWLVKHSPKAHLRPADVEYLIWISYVREATMMPDENSVVLELSIDPEIITPVNINKWGAILNYSYIPKDEKDAARHRELLEMYGVSDAKACMTQFYPQIKKEVIDSWERLFDKDILLGNALEYGTIWEIRKEWVKSILK